MQSIGLRHPAVQRARDLVSNSIPNGQKFFVAEGLWTHRLLVESALPVDVFLWCPEAAGASEVRTRATEMATRARSAYQISERTLARLSERTRPDGLVSIAQLPVWNLTEFRPRDDSLVVVADGMEIAGNLGTLLRSADAAAVDLVILTNRRVRLTHPKVLKASLGALFTVPVIEADEATADAWLRRHGFEVLLADTDDSVSYHQLDFRQRRTAFVLGAERYGLSRAWRDSGHQRVKIPMHGRMDSLNVSTSAAVLMFHARGLKTPV